MKSNRDDQTISRRGALRAFLAPIAGVAVHRLVSGCGVGADEPEANAMLADQVAADASVSDVAWASGGTQAMKGGYPDPFATAPGLACALTPAMILGPCYGTTLTREDVSEGVPGVPMRLSLLVVRADGCTPVSGATIDIWHTGANGLYSTFAPGSFCNPSKADLTTDRFCRGVQTTDEQGQANFSSVVPGWYNGRAPHVHFIVRVDGKEYVTSQLFFEDALLDDIEQQPDYIAHGKRDTRNDQDILLPKDDRTPFVLSWAKRSDGTLHAWKVLVLRDSLDDALPSAPIGLSGGGFPRGFPGSGGFPSLDGGIPSFPGFPAGDGGVPGFPGFPGFPGRGNQDGGVK